MEGGPWGLNSARGKFKVRRCAVMNKPRSASHSRDTRKWCTAPCFPRKATGVVHHLSVPCLARLERRPVPTALSARRRPLSCPRCTPGLRLGSIKPHRPERVPGKWPVRGRASGRVNGHGEHAPRLAHRPLLVAGIDDHGEGRLGSSPGRARPADPRYPTVLELSHRVVDVALQFALAPAAAARGSPLSSIPTTHLTVYCISLTFAFSVCIGRAGRC